ncbi:MULTISPECIES: sulfotransferase family 2 domain-containing protein [Rhodomicrobium]|uniref:sulfotransferase family 2 domain-containing protein n=1 Tax=Rhodomicrobium TaxID=1068 RepID=UPI001482B075|nr:MULTISPECIES: sulfotransferase family 2 domain-containing protein [Rhodomicrobium]
MVWPLRRPPRIVFVHIGKTAGSWVHRQIKRRYRRSEICPLEQEEQFPDDVGKLDNYRLIKAHFGHAYASRIDAAMITVLRDPLERVVSVYYYLREFPLTQGGHGLAKGLSFREFIFSDHPAIRQAIENTQTWQIAASHHDRTRAALHDMPGDRLLARAKANLADFAAVGVTEDFPAFAKLLRRKLAIKIDPRGKPSNVTQSRPKLDDLSSLEIDRIMQLTELDRQLYDYVRASQDNAVPLCN